MRKGDNFASADLHGIDLSKTTVPETELMETDLTGANLSGSFFGSSTSIGFIQAILRDANLQNTTIRCSLDTANLEHVNAAGSVIDTLDMYKTILTNSNLTGARISNVTGGSDVDFSESNCQNMRASNCYFDNANFSHCDLRNAVFDSSCDHNRCSFEGADLRGAKLHAALIRGCNFTGAKVDATTEVNLSMLKREGNEGVDVFEKSLGK